MSELVFRAEDHTYWLDGRQIPALHDILGDMGFCPNNGFYTEGSAARGRAIHLATQLFDEGMTAEEAINSLGSSVDGDLGYAIEGYIRDYAAFREQNTGFRWFQIEEPIANERLRYATTPDRVGIDPDDEPCVLDIKSGQKEKWHKVQLAGQDFSKKARRYALYITDTPGKFSLIRFDDPGDSVAWEYAAWLWWYQRAKL